MHLHGWLILDKPFGLGSTQAVSAVKRALREGGYPKVKVGHGGTLDPLASGVLPVALGEATKLAGRLLDSDKVYDFTVSFGSETTTLDAEGAVVATSDVRPSPAEVAAVLPCFTGPIVQVPPAYSALMIEGRRAYDVARAGEEVTLAERAVTVHSLEHLAHSRHPREGGGPYVPNIEQVAPSQVSASMDPRLRGDDEGHGEKRNSQRLETATFRAQVSKGTYIRSLARDIARTLGTVGHVTMLRRLKAGPFGLDGAISLDKLAELGQGRALGAALLPLTAGLDGIPALSVTPDQARALREGRTLFGVAAHPGLHLATEASRPVALVEADALQVRVVRGFNL